MSTVELWENTIWST